ncbi:MAG: hypothetical protein IJX98_05580 [Clostridia bacterium]|nr:hypothetical protein [Clostridia bacterium]
MKATKEKLIIFVCTGNTCRSPMAEAVFRYELKRRGKENVAVRSAGTEASNRGGMHPHSLQTLETHGLTVENFAPTQLDEEMILSAYAIICMTDEQRDLVSYLRWKLLKGEERAENNVYSFSDFCGYQVPDPYGYGIEAYEKTYEAISSATEPIFAALLSEEKPKKPRKPRATKSGAAKKKTSKKSTKKKTGQAGKRRPKKEK